MADKLVIEFNGIINAFDLILPDAQIDHRNMRRRVPEDHRKQDQGFHGAPHHIVDITTEGFAEGMT